MAAAGLVQLGHAFCPIASTKLTADPEAVVDYLSIEFAEASVVAVEV